MNGQGAGQADSARTPVWNEAAALDDAGRHLDAIALLSRAAAGGDLFAKRTVGLRILLGDRAPLLGPDGARLIAEAASEGDAASAHLSAILAGGGIHCAQDWNSALDWLERAASLGWQRAQDALSVLCADPETALGCAEAGLWHEIRANVNIAALLASPPGCTIHDDPLVGVHPHFASPRICAWLIAQAQGRLSRAQVYNPYTGGVEDASERTNRAALFSLLDTDLVQVIVQSRIAAAVDASFSQLEPAAVLHYATGQVFEDHYDFVDPQTPGYAQEIARNGQRRITFLLYLNDGYEGGETAFPRLGLSHRARAGDALFFVNVRPDGVGDTRTLHAGRPPIRGEKWVLSQFIRDRAIVPGTPSI
jgi:prolyl 4-hydroxylase